MVLLKENLKSEECIFNQSSKNGKKYLDLREGLKTNGKNEY